MRLSPAISTVKKSPVFGIASSRPTQHHSRAKMRSCSEKKTSGEVYQEAASVFAPAPTFGLTKVAICVSPISRRAKGFLSRLTESALNQQFVWSFGKSSDETFGK